MLVMPPTVRQRCGHQMMERMGELILLRHGETEWSATGRHTGRTDVPLTPRGEAQAAALARAFARRKIQAVFTSPAERAVRTAKLAGLDGARQDPDLWEWDYGGYEGRTTAQIGRASCRERVEISVVAVSLKNKS